MARYHYNFEAGTIGVCKAKTKCPLSNAPHFDDEVTAKSYVEEIESLNNSTTKTFKKKLNNRSINKDVENFARGFMVDGRFVLGSWHSPERFDDFEYIDKGAERNVYLSRNGKFVYKIANDFDALSVEDIQELQELDRYNYENINNEFLLENNCEYLETKFIDLIDNDGARNTIIVQPYLNSDEYDDVEVNPFKDSYGGDTELNQVFEDMGFADLEVFNMKLRKSDGRIILFDCLAYPED